MGSLGSNSKIPREEIRGEVSVRYREPRQNTCSLREGNVRSEKKESDGGEEQGGKC